MNTGPGTIRGIRLVADGPAVHIEDRGAGSPPWRGPGRPRGTLRGAPVARVVRALVDLAPPMTVRALVGRPRLDEVVDCAVTGSLAAPASTSVFDRGATVDGVRYAAPSQVAVDLSSGPGRNPSEGEELVTWMEHHEHEWRS